MFEDQGSRRIRVNSCLQLIHDVSARLADEGLPQRITEQLDRLDQVLSLIDHRAVTDTDLDRIEGSTNQLMSELQLLFDHRGLGSLYDDAIH